MRQVGDPVPDVRLWVLNDDGPEAVFSREVLGEGTVVLFAVPGASTPGCSRVRLPGYVEHAEELARRGVDRVACALMLADGNADFNARDGPRDGGTRRASVPCDLSATRR